MERLRPSSTGVSTARRWGLERPSHWLQSLVVVAVAGVLYWGLVLLTGGFARGDADSSMYSAVMFSHGHWSCAYRSIPDTQPLAGPVFPLVAALVQWITRVGFAPGYLTSGQIGSHCQHAYDSYVAFSAAADGSPFGAALASGLVSWLALALASVAIVRATPLRGTRATWLAPAILALVPPVLFCLQEYYHPQDILALALAFFAVALGLRRRWYGAGVLWALAVMCQPFAWLGVAVVGVVSPRADRGRLVVGGALCLALAGGVLDVICGPRSVFAALVGTGNTTAEYGSWMYELRVGPGAGLVISRVGPLLGTVLVAWWARSRRPDVDHDPVLLLGVLATAWSLRLVFEENLWGYYCMATGATLVVRDILERRVARGTVYWLVLVVVAFGTIRSHSRPWEYWPDWVWQVILAPTAAVVAFVTLRSSMARSSSFAASARGVHDLDTTI